MDAGVHSSLNKQDDRLARTAAAHRPVWKSPSAEAKISE
jgi:hypothetical protein